MKITLPEGFPMPDNARPGEPFEVVATIAPSEDGGFSITALDGMPVDGDESEEPEMEEEEPEEEGSAVTDYNDASQIKLPF